jgi:hypothetical protein
MRYKLRTLPILSAAGPPLIALTWWYEKTVMGVLVLSAIFCPDLVLGVAFYTFGALCHLIGGKPFVGPRKD